MKPPFRTDHRPEIGVAEWLEPDIRAITAPNGGPMTFTGTRSYLLGTGKVALIDPGPMDPAHIAAIRAALGDGEEIEAILVTHAHLDHSPGCAAFDIPVYAFGPPEAGRSAVMAGLSEIGGGEGVDRSFAPDHMLADGAVLEGTSWRVEAVHTPGHISSHLAFASDDRLFSGDHVMGWATTLISPPDGDLTQFMASLDRCLSRSDRVYYPGHGASVENPAEILRYIRNHRMNREAQILEALGEPADPKMLTARIYHDVDPRLLPAAERNVLAHLIDLTTRGLVAPAGTMARDAVFQRV